MDAFNIIKWLFRINQQKKINLPFSGRDSTSDNDEIVTQLFNVGLSLIDLSEDLGFRLLHCVTWTLPKKLTGRNLLTLLSRFFS